ncbi:SpoIVB peptidase [Acetatifactor muris]|uniref:SpoIVB peptidase n=1 Tax=Acetatifactor muris TaxID=879566 RepID=A0A2K4ZEF2_9FIRM|nr:SpoIVB peptidase [Acetatifactor muris]MCI8798627.1 SpoIVB peptidase [Lachnospiraceae bacterium]MCR2048457.1 SpoIVB peptidase [Acetatifactor muris]SOY28843.1 SpoIVB peptidase precursor [Acetatifactor muris]
MRRSNETRPVRKIKSVIDGKKFPGGESVRGNSEQLKKQAGNNMVVLLQNWKSREKRYKIYRAFLSLTLLISCLSLTGLLYYYIDSSIPSVINVRAGEAESFYLGVPARAEIVAASDQGVSNIPQGAVDIDLSKPVTLRAAMESSYQMQVKLFGFLSFKNVDIRVIEDQELIPVGTPVGIYVKTDGVLVVGTGEFQGSEGISYSPGKYILKSGDYIRKINGEAVTEKDDFIRRVEESGGAEIRLTVERDGELMEAEIKPEQDVSGKYKIGVWVRDNAQGVGTMTYIDSHGNFGALGHGITDVDTSTLMHMEGGTLYQTDIVDIQKGTSGNPGEMTGMIIYSDERILGDITDNSVRGIFGACNSKALEMGVEEPLPIGLKQEIEEGVAQILCTVDGSTRYYDVEITAVHLDHDNVNRGIELTVTDPDLLAVTGGIVQGMSGSPIIQNGKFIGAVTHVLVQDSKKGYGIFIENMLEH